MDRMKTFKTYFYILVGFAAIVMALTYWSDGNLSRNMRNHNVNFDSPKVVVKRSRVSDKRGYVKYEVTNNTTGPMESKSLKFDFYNAKDEYIGSKFKGIGKLEENQTKEFTLEYDFENVNRMEINLSNTVHNNWFAEYFVGYEEYQEIFVVRRCIGVLVSTITITK